MPYYGGTPMAANPDALMARLMRSGLSRAQAAAMVGNLRRESSLISNNVNQGEQAYGLMQWRGDRFEELMAFAAKQGKTWTDPDVQADFAVHEMRSGKEQKAGKAFLGATDVPSANQALKGVIRYADQPGETEARGALAQQAFGSTHGARPVTVQHAQGNVQQVRGQPGSAGAEILSPVPRGVYAPVAQGPSSIGGRTTQGDYPGLRSGLPQTGQASETALPPVRREELADASSRLQQAAGNPVAMPYAPYGASRETLDDQGRPKPKGIRGGLSALGHDLRMAGVLGTRPAQAPPPGSPESVAGFRGLFSPSQTQPPPPGSPESVSAFKGLFGPLANSGQSWPGTQSYIDPNTGSQMATGLPGRYDRGQGDVLNLGRPPAVTSFGQASQPAAMASRDRLPDELALHADDFQGLV